MQKENNDLNRSFKHALANNEPAWKYFSPTGEEKSKNKIQRLEEKLSRMQDKKVYECIKQDMLKYKGNYTKTKL